MKHPRDLFAEMPVAVHKITPTENYEDLSGSAVKWRGLHLEFDNGRILSIQAHPWSYASTREYAKDFLQVKAPAHLKNWYNVATSVEIATWWNESGLQEMPGGDTVMGYVTEPELLAFVFDLLTADVAFGMPVSSPLLALGENWREEFDDLT